MALTSVARKRHLRIIVVIIVLAVAAASVYAISANNVTSPDAVVSPSNTSVVSKTSQNTTFGLPVSLEIPKINVATDVSYMGLTTDGDMDVPPDLISVGWYKYGAKPGDVGSAVIAGHLRGTEDLGVFNDLDLLQPGDIVNVHNDHGDMISFAVRETRSYRENERASEVFNKADGAYLNLITCSGTWDSAQQLYSHRFVVFAEKIASES